MVLFFVPGPLAPFRSITAFKGERPNENDQDFSDMTPLIYTSSMSGAEASKWFRLDGVLAFFSSTQNLRHVIHQVWFCNSFAQYFLPLSTAWTSSVPSPQNQERCPSLSLNRSEKNLSPSKKRVGGCLVKEEFNTSRCIPITS